MPDMRTVFAETASALLDEDPLAAVVLAEISADLFAKAAARHPDRVLNVGIREQLMVSVGGGLALAGMRPIMHSYAPFLVERAFEQVKLDLAHQGARAVLVSIGASYDAARGGRTHQAPEDVALVDTVPGFAVVVPGHPDEVPEVLRSAVGALSSSSTYVRLSSEANRSDRARKNSAPPPSSAPRSCSCVGVFTVSRSTGGMSSGAVSARYSATQPSLPGSDPWPTHRTSPVLVSSSSIDG